MADDTIHATTTIDASPEVVFDILADPAQHAAIDGTGWVCEPLDGEPLTGVGQIFRMGMFHHNHPDGNYQISNRVEVLDPPKAIAWQPGYIAEDGELALGGWVWRYDLTSVAADRTEVTLTYDWSAVGEAGREHFSFPPFPPDHLSNSLAHLAGLAESRA